MRALTATTTGTRKRNRAGTTPNPSTAGTMTGEAKEMAGASRRHPGGTNATETNTTTPLAIAPLPLPPVNASGPYEQHDEDEGIAERVENLRHLGRRHDIAGGRHCPALAATRCDRRKASAASSTLQCRWRSRAPENLLGHAMRNSTRTASLRTRSSSARVGRKVELAISPPPSRGGLFKAGGRPWGLPPSGWPCPEPRDSSHGKVGRDSLSRGLGQWNRSATC